jgi:diguanylate cyclase (GGDEF)-like protein
MAPGENGEGMIGFRLTGQHDGLLLAGFVLQFASEVEHVYNVRLLPGLVVLVAILIVHLFVRRQRMKLEAENAAAGAHLAQERARDLERLAMFGSALAASLSPDMLRASLWRHLPVLAERREVWVAVGDTERFEVLLETSGTQSGLRDAEDVARKAFASQAGTLELAADASGRRFYCVPIVAGGTLLGVIGLDTSSEPLTDRLSRTLTAAAALLGIAVRNQKLFAELRENALTDPLTSCFNRGHTLHVIDAELRRTRRTRSPFSVVMLDIDQFKGINDRLGHLAGDAVLGAVGRRLGEVLRNSDVRGRFGGDEFIIVLPDTPSAGAMHVAEAIRRELEKLDIEVGDGVERVTASVGVVTVEGDERDAATVVGAVDRALYQAKEGGRNHVVLAQESEIATARKAS